jgi:transcriptional regulator with XRE-family HTH domain
MYFERIRQLRAEKGLTTAETAEILDINVRCYECYENGDVELSVYLLGALADLYEVSTDYIVGRTDSRLCR